MVFLKNTFWHERPPTVQEGILAACWAVDYAIEVGAPMVGRDINAFALAADRRGRVRATQVSPEEIRDHRSFIAAGRERLRELADLRQPSSQDADQIPTMAK
jgi:hypothetical protein